MVAIIYKIASRLASKFTFPNYEEEDIAQEAFIIGMEAMNRYDEVRPLENFLSVHIKNRLMNFKRDNYYRPDDGKAEVIQQGKKKLLDAQSMDDMKNLLLAAQNSDNLENRELMEYIDTNLPTNLRGDYLRFRTDHSLTKTKRARLIEELRTIVEKFYA